MDELKCYATFKNIDFDNFESYSSAIFVFGHHIYKTLDEQLYNFLLDQLNQLLIEFKKDSFDVELKKDFIFFLKSYLSALYCSVDGKVDYKKYPKEDDIEFIKLEDVPKLKS